MIWAIVAASAALAAAQAKKSNDAIEESGEAATGGTNTQNTQLARQEATEAVKRSRETTKVLGRLRVAGTEAGTADEALQSLANEAAINADENDGVGGNNLTANIARSNSNLEATIASLAAGQRDVALSTINGGLQGLQLGLSINGMLTGSSGTVDPLTGNELPRSLRPYEGTLPNGAILGDLTPLN